MAARTWGGLPSLRQEPPSPALSKDTPTRAQANHCPQRSGGDQGRVRPCQGGQDKGGLVGPPLARTGSLDGNRIPVTLEATAPLTMSIFRSARSAGFLTRLGFRGRTGTERGGKKGSQPAAKGTRGVSWGWAACADPSPCACAHGQGQSGPVALCGLVAWSPWLALSAL